MRRKPISFLLFLLSFLFVPSHLLCTRPLFLSALLCLRFPQTLILRIGLLLLTFKVSTTKKVSRTNFQDRRLFFFLVESLQAGPLPTPFTPPITLIVFTSPPSPPNYHFPSSSPFHTPSFFARIPPSMPSQTP